MFEVANGPYLDVSLYFGETRLSQMKLTYTYCLYASFNNACNVLLLISTLLDSYKLEYQTYTK